VVALRASRQGDELLAVSLCGLCSAAAAPFAWSHHWVWVVPVLVALAARAVAGSRTAGVLAGVVLASTIAVITALPGPDVGPIPSTGLISLFPDAYLLLFVLLLATGSGTAKGPAGVAGPFASAVSR